MENYEIRPALVSVLSAVLVGKRRCWRRREPRRDRELRCRTAVGTHPELTVKAKTTML